MRTAPGFTQALGCLGFRVGSFVDSCCCCFLTSSLELSGWDTADLVERSAVVEPVDLLERGVFEVVEAPLRSPVTNQLGLVETDDRLGQGVVIRIAAGAD